MFHQMTSRVSAAMQSCIDECLGCYATCETTIGHCMELGGRHSEAGHIRLLSDCVRICLVAADFITRGSDSYPRISGTCAEVCRQCADNCERIDASDESMKRCAAGRRSCAEIGSGWGKPPDPEAGSF